MYDRTHAKELAKQLYATLVPLWPDQGPLLNWNNPFELLIAVVLSAQCTDEQVNKVTPALFKAYPNPETLAKANLVQVEGLIRSTGFYHHKARNIIGAAQRLVESYGGVVPDSIDELVSLPGVGRKTANLVVSAVYGKPGIVVDTHVLRSAARLGLAPTNDAEKSERMIADSIESEKWTELSFALNRLGKHVCRARKPLCGTCPIRALCPSASEFS